MQMKQKLNVGGDASFQAEYMSGLQEFESDLQSKKAGRPRLSDKPDTKVELQESQSFEKRKCVGVFWPAHVYKKYENKPIPRRRRHVQDGEVGIILPSNFKEFIPDNCTQLFDVGSKSATKTALVSSSDLQIRDEQNDEMFAQAKRRCSVKSKLTKSKSGESISVYHPTQDEDTNNLFADFWTGGDVKCSLDSSSDEEFTKERKRKASPSSPKTPARKTQGDAQNNSGKRSKLVSADDNREKEAHSTRKLLLEGEEKLRLLNTLQACKVNVKSAFEKLAAAVAARLDEEWLQAEGHSSLMAIMTALNQRMQYALHFVLSLSPHQTQQRSVCL